MKEFITEYGDKKSEDKIAIEEPKAKLNFLPNTTLTEFEWF